MIHQIFSSTLDSFKTQDLRSGCNLIVAEKTAGASDQQTRNSAGKSSLVEIINFVLGSEIDKASIFGTDALKDHRFGMSFDLGSHRVVAERSGATNRRFLSAKATQQNGLTNLKAVKGSVCFRSRNGEKCSGL
jgi:uncharacterized protein YydD (DUF2326 family)